MSLSSGKQQKVPPSIKTRLVEFGHCLTSRSIIIMHVIRVLGKKPPRKLPRKPLHSPGKFGRTAVLHSSSLSGDEDSVSKEENVYEDVIAASCLTDIPCSEKSVTFKSVLLYSSASF